MLTVTCYDLAGNKLNELCQWDTDVDIRISGADMSSAPMLHFCQRGRQYAYVVPTTLGSEYLEASIPNVVLQSQYPITVYLYYTNDSNEKRSMYSFNLNIVPRQKPQDYTYEENIGYINWVEKTIEIEQWYATMQTDVDDKVSEFENNVESGTQSINELSALFQEQASVELEKLSSAGFRIKDNYIQGTTDGSNWENLVLLSNLKDFALSVSDDGAGNVELKF